MNTELRVCVKMLATCDVNRIFYTFFREQIQCIHISCLLRYVKSFILHFLITLFNLRSIFANFCAILISKFRSSNVCICTYQFLNSDIFTLRTGHLDRKINRRRLPFDPSAKNIIPFKCSFRSHQLIELSVDFSTGNELPLTAAIDHASFACRT